MTERTAAQKQQQLEALAKANEVRFLRIELSRQIKDGEIDICRVLRDPPPFINTMTLYDLLICQRLWGAKRALNLLNRGRISPYRTIAETTPRQRKEVANYLMRLRRDKAYTGFKP